MRITDYMRGWARVTLGGPGKVKDEPVLHIKDLKGIDSVLLMTADDELPEKDGLCNVICDTWHAALDIGLNVDPRGTEREFGVTRDTLRQYLPVACPQNAVTEDGIIRPWDSDTGFGKKQATALLKLIREAFWAAVGNYSSEYEKLHQGENYAQVEMIESFCKDYRTDEVYVEAMRREWQRRLKRVNS